MSRRLMLRRRRPVTGARFRAYEVFIYFECPPIITRYGKRTLVKSNTSGKCRRRHYYFSAELDDGLGFLRVGSRRKCMTSLLALRGFDS